MNPAQLHKPTILGSQLNYNRNTNRPTVSPTRTYSSQGYNTIQPIGGSVASRIPPINGTVAVSAPQFSTAAAPKNLKISPSLTPSLHIFLIYVL